MRKLQEYLKEVIRELKKVSWPSKEDLKGSTFVVVFFSLAMAAFIWGADLILSKVFEAVMR